MNLSKNNFIAHRGLHKGREIPENSLKAFKEAILNHYAIEFDINITKDNQIIVFHDENLYRLCGIKENIENIDYSFFKELKLYESSQYIPLFKEVLELVKGKVPLIIEIKKHKNIGKLETKLIDILSFYKGEYFLCSFEKEILCWLKKNNPTLKIGLIFESLPRKFEKYNKTIFLYKFFKTKPDFISLSYDLFNSSIFQFIRKNNLFVMVWTIKTKEEYEKINKKADAIIFEDFI